jgi:LysM repeat protein
MYYVYLGKMLLPVAPESIETSTGSNNEVYNLINDGELTVIKSRPLQEISFGFLLPTSNYSFAHYKSGFIGASVFLDYLQEIKEGKDPIQLVVTRSSGIVGAIQAYSGLFNNLKVTLEDYSVTESTEYGRDYWVSVTLKEYQDPKYYVPASKLGSLIGAITSRSTTTSPKPKKTSKTYTVKSGDTLWAIAKKYYGDGAKYKTIAEANKLSNPNLIYPNQKLIIPVVSE